MPSQYDALLLVSFGGPEGPDDVLPFLQNVTRRRNTPPERLAAFPWTRAGSPTLAAVVEELAARGVARFVLAHGGRSPDLATLGPLAARPNIDLLVAGGVTDLEGIRRLRDAGIAGIILGEALLSGAIDYPAAREAAA